MKNVTLYLILSSIPLFAQQKHDNIWPLGYGSNLPEESFGGSMLTFSDSEVDTAYFEIPFDFEANGAICDSVGNLLFYTNLCEVANRNHVQMLNGDSISYGGPSLTSYCEDGYPVGQGVVILPKPGSSHDFIMLHLPTNGQYAYAIFQTLIDMDGDGGLGEVTLKNDPIKWAYHKHSITGVRHGNGRDWWVLVPMYDGNGYETILVDTEGAHEPFVQEIGIDKPGMNTSTQNVFSPNGQKYAYMNVDNDTLFLYDFDRCSGLLSNEQAIAFLDDTIYIAGVSFSPNSRFLYVAFGEKIYQLDIENQDISESRILIDVWDGFADPWPAAAGIDKMMLAPDDKIYISTTSSTRYLHVINAPDSLGTACDFQQHSLRLPTYNYYGLPNFPYFRLLDWGDSPCDTLGIDGGPLMATQQPQGTDTGIKVSPNPATTSLTITLPSGISAQSMSVTCTNMLGQVLAVPTTTQGGAIQADVSSLSSGLYFCSVSVGSKKWTQKVVVAR